MTAGRKTYAAVLLVALATLAYEVLLTRIFSVTMWYHCAFMAVSIALFGATVGGILVYTLPRHFPIPRTDYQLALSSLLFAITAPASFLLHQFIPLGRHNTLLEPLYTGLVYTLISVPFVFSGACLALALTRFRRQVSSLYAFDLIGAGLGSIFVFAVLRLMDGPAGVMAVALVACTSCALFTAQADAKLLARLSAAYGLALALFLVANAIYAQQQSPLLRLTYVKGGFEGAPLLVKWNSFSRIRISGDPTREQAPSGWGQSQAAPGSSKVRRLNLTIDAAASSELIGFTGDLEAVGFLKYDITNIVHYFRSDARVLIIGPGGGRDILAALVFDQDAIVAVELNQDILKVVNGRFGDFTGHLDTYPQVVFVADEARSYIERREDSYDIIQASFVDTWAATAAGAYSLAENALYTLEAWRSMLHALTPNGILTFSRWYTCDRPGEALRLVSLARAALRETGISNPRPHIILVTQIAERASVGIATILVSSHPFTVTDLQILEDVTERLDFNIQLSPDSYSDQAFATLASGEDLAQFYERLPMDVSPPTDDRPFFFNMLRLRDILRREPGEGGIESTNLTAVAVLGTLLIIGLCLTGMFIVLPIRLTSKRGDLKKNGSLLVYFAAIGMGFMLIEISQIQRLSVFLGHPMYSLSMVIPCLLLSSGIGSYTTRRIPERETWRKGAGRWLLLLLTMVAFGSQTPHLINLHRGASTSMRLAVAFLALCPLGIVMGMAFPLGMKVAHARSTALTPWLWGINGATSVLGSIVAMVIAIGYGIASAFWSGAGCYFIAFLAFSWIAVRRPQIAPRKGHPPHCSTPDPL